jgi:lipopolysaccharide/colanic/teichoic acid biosynthesis glycosyltransferase
VTALEAFKHESRVEAVPAGGAPRALPDRGWRRWWQVAVAAGGLLLLSPLACLIALAVKATSRGPVLYRGTRIGRDLRPFTIYKFRTLLVDAEQRIGARLLTPADTLFTPIGRFLKRYKLDEIPQLLNVIGGDMNLVGPRPIRPVFLAVSMRDIPHYRARFAVRPGMTGLAQLRGNYFTPPRDKLRYDMLYVRHRAFPLDAKLVLATFVKLLNRWLTLGLLLGLVFFCASFVPAVFSAPFEITLGGFHLSPFEAGGLVLAGVVLVRQIPAHRLYLYRTPTNWPMACFVAFAVAAGVVGGDLVPRLRDVAYFTATGFLLFFLIVSGEISDGFASRATRAVALAAVAVSLLGILEIVMQTHAHASAGGLARLDRVPGITATLGNPVVLAAYLVLGMPLVLVELSCAERREERDFWLICATLVVVCVLLTQTRTGLCALWVTASVFCWRLSRRMFGVFSAAALAFLAMMVVVGGLGLAPAQLAGQWTRRAALTAAAVRSQRALVDVLVGPEPGRGAVSVVDVAAGARPGARRAQVENMHLTLVRRIGVVGWAIMMWIIGAALLAIRRGSSAVPDERLGRTLWAIFSSGLGFLVSMSGFNAFYSPSIQVLFWGLLGVGMAIVVHRNARRPTFNVIWRFGVGE